MSEDMARLRTLAQDLDRLTSMFTATMAELLEEGATDA